MSDAVDEVFEQLHELENIDVQAFMREMENETLMTALKDSTGKTVDKFLANMSSRARSMFTEEMEGMTWITREDTQAARAKIVTLLAQLVQKGGLSLPPSIVLPDDSRIKTMGTRIEERIDEMDKKLDLLLQKVDELRSKIT
ncbi:MAG: FliG C-terminal domain-containing protein [Candidatus Azotimanducaceae bacterium]